MRKVLPVLISLVILSLTAIACAAAAPVATPLPGADPSNCARFPDEADRQREHDAIQWQLCPVIENGVLRAAGTTTGEYRVHGGGQNFPTFVIQYRNTDNPFYVIRRPVPDGYSPPTYYGYTFQSGRAVIAQVTPSTYAGIPAYKSKSRSTVATHWEFRPQFFSIKAYVGNPGEPVDLWVWGSDAPTAYENSSRMRRQRGLRGWILPARRGKFNAKPLAIRSIGYIDYTRSDDTPTPTTTATPRSTRRPIIATAIPATARKWERPTRLPTITPWASPSPRVTQTPDFTPQMSATRMPGPTLVETFTCSPFADGTALFREHNAVQWSECPVIENGILRAAGTVLGGRALLHSTSVATFVIKYRNTDRDALTILRPAPPGAYYPNTPGTAEAILWDVSIRSFSIKVPVGNLAEPVDLLVWGSDIPGANIKAPPLAIHSIRYIK